MEAFGDIRGSNGFGLGLFDEAQSGVMKVVQFRFARFITGEFDQVAAIKKLAEAGLLVGRQEVGSLKFVEELLGGAFRSVEIETLFQIPADCIGH